MSFLVDVVAIICWHKLTSPLVFRVSVPRGSKTLELASRCVQQQFELINHHNFGMEHPIGLKL